MVTNGLAVSVYIVIGNFDSLVTFVGTSSFIIEACQNIIGN